MTWNPKPATAALILRCNEIISDYDTQGYKMTLRQLYYQLVATNAIPNSERSYKRLVNVMTEARWNGYTPIDALVDAGREAIVQPTWRSPHQLLEACADQFASNWWRGSSTRVEVWVEKAALIGVIEPVCELYQVTALAARGYVSLPALVDARDRVGRKRLHIIYLGDHDPSGLHMSDDIAERLGALVPELIVERVALTWNQITEHNPPPQPAKVSDSRFADYVMAHGDESWELDALPPSVLSQIVAEAIEPHLPHDFVELQEADQRASESILRAMDHLDWERS